MFYGILTEASLSNKQMEFVYEKLNKECLPELEKIAKVELDKFPKLKKYCSTLADYYFEGSLDKGLYTTFAIIGNYAYEEDAEDKEAEKLIDEYIKDIVAFGKVLKQKFAPLKFGIYISDDSDRKPAEYKKYMIDNIRNEHSVYPDELIIYAVVTKSTIKRLTPNESDISESEKSKYTKIYTEFAKFVKHPFKLTGSSFWSAHLADVCKILGISSDKFNSVISKNIKPIGKPFIINGDNFENDPDWGKSLSKKLGQCYLIEDTSDADQIIYSTSTKKMYWINYEHTECEVFFNNLPFNSKELEDVVYEDLANKEERSAVIELFKRIDQEKGFNLLTTVFK
jgi:hypothetical protein